MIRVQVCEKVQVCLKKKEKLVSCKHIRVANIFLRTLNLSLLSGTFQKSTAIGKSGASNLPLHADPFFSILWEIQLMSHAVLQQFNLVSVHREKKTIVNKQTRQFSVFKASNANAKNLQLTWLVI